MVQTDIVDSDGMVGKFGKNSKWINGGKYQEMLKMLRKWIIRCKNEKIQKFEKTVNTELSENENSSKAEKFQKNWKMAGKCWRSS